MANCPTPNNPSFTRDGDSVFQNVTIWGKSCFEELNAGKSLFKQDAKFEKDVTIDGTLDISILEVKTSLDVGAGGTVLTADTRTDRVGIFTDTPIEKVQILSGNNGIVVTGLGTVGIATTNPAGFANDGSIKVDIDGSISIQEEIYDSRNLKGFPGNFLSKDENGITWVSFEPAFQEGIFLMDEGVYVPTPGQGGVVGAGQSFSIVNFVQSNSRGIGTDTLVPTARDPSTFTGLATVFTSDFWGYDGTGANASIYRMTNVGIGSSIPNTTLDIIGNSHIAGIVTITKSLDVGLGLTVGLGVTVGTSLTVTENTFLGGILTVFGDTKVGGGLTVAKNAFVSGIVTISQNTFLDSQLDVDGATTLNDSLDVDGATTLNSTLDVDGATTLNSTLDVDGSTTFNDTTQATSTTNASVQIDGGVGIVKKLFVGQETKLESTVDSSSKDTGSLVVEGGVGIEKKLFVGTDLNVDNNAKIVGTLELDNSIIDANQQTGVAGKDYRLSSVGAGVSWRPSGVETKNTIWVTKNGNDSNSGLLEGDAKLTIGAAAAVAQDGDTIIVRPGVYSENNPVGLRTDVTITGQDLRLVTVVPQNPTKDVFHVRRGCLIENLNFAGSSITVQHTGAGAVAFAPADSSKQANTGFIQLGPITEGSSGRWRSPYVRNCTNFMTGSIGMRIDGDDATASIPGADLKSMVCDSFTQYNEAGIGVSLTNNAYAQLVSIFTINCDIAIYADTGAQCDLTNSNSSFGNFGLVAVGLGSTQYSGIISNTNPSGDIITSTLPENQDTVVLANVVDNNANIRRPFDGQAAYFKIDLGNYPDAVGTGAITAPLNDVGSIKILNGGSGFSQVDPPDVIIRDLDGTVAPKGPQGIVAEASATVSAAGTITSIDIINSGRSYLPTQNIVVEINGNTGLATAVMEPIYYTVSEATDPTSTGITTVTFNEFIPYELFPDDAFTLQRISRILTSSHSFEYVGTGTSINTSLPFEGALPIKENEIVFRDGAQIPFTATDQKGNFEIGEGIQVDQTTSTVRGRDFSKAIQAEVTPLILALR